MDFSKYITWFEKTAGEAPQFEPLKRHENCDVCIIGSAFTGVSTAWHLAKKGKKVVVIEPSRIGFGCSGRSGGLIQSGLNTELDDIAELVGRTSAWELWQSSINARKAMVNAIRENDIKCDLNFGLIAHSSHKRLEQTYRDKASYFGNNFENEHIQFLSEAMVKNETSASAINHALFYKDSGSFHPLKFLHALVEKAESEGVRFHEKTPVNGITPGEEITVFTAHGNVTCKNLVVCGNAYMGEVMSPEKTKTVSTNYFQAVTQPLTESEVEFIGKNKAALVNAGQLPDYIQFDAENRIILGGVDHSFMKGNEAFAAAKVKELEKLYPSLKGRIEIDYLWRGPVGVPMNFMPEFNVEENIYSAHGFNGQGVHMAFYAGYIMAEAINGDDTQLELFSKIKQMPMPRLVHHALARLTVTYYKIKDRLFAS